MSAPLIWIIFPAAFGGALLVFRRRLRGIEMGGALTAALLAAFAFRFPDGGFLSIRSFAIQIRSTLPVLGRQLTISENMMGIIAVFYAALFLWFLLAIVVKPSPYFVPLGFIVGAVLVAAISFRPWEFVGIFLLIAVFLLVIMLRSVDMPVGQGVLNFLSFNVLGIPLLLIAGSLISGLAGTPPGLPVVALPSIFLGLGFAFVLALFPFHAWVPRLGEEGNPFAAGFVFVFLPAVVVILLLQLIDRNVWLRNSIEVFTFIRTVGLVTVIVAGFFAAFQRNLGRILGFSALIETGLFLLAIGAGAREATGLIFPLIASRSLGFLVWAAGLAEIKKEVGGLSFRKVQGVARRHPVIASAVVLGTLSSVGMPLLAGYLPRMRLFAALTSTSPSAAVALWIGSFGLLLVTFRTMAVLVMLPEKDDETDPESLPAWDLPLDSRDLLIGMLGVAIVVVGIFPQWIEPLTEWLPLAFDHLRP